MEPLLRQFSLAWENPPHLPGHSLQAPAQGSARVSPGRLQIATQTYLCDSPNNTGQDLARPRGRGWQQRREAGPGACWRRKARPPRPVLSAPTDPAVPARAGEPGVPRAGLASGAHSASPPYLTTAPPSPAPNLPATRSPARPGDTQLHPRTASSVARAVS